MTPHDAGTPTRSDPRAPLAPAQWQRVKRLFHAASDLERGAQGAYVRSECGDDAGLCECVLRLLQRRAEEPAGYLEGLSLGPLADAPGTIAGAPRGWDGAGSRVGGRYTLLRPLGEGGFGEVYLSRQDEPVRRTVALKILKPGMDSRQIVARFEAERQALAMMDHPGIATIFDAGMVGTRPYFVMEYVAGVRIDQYCDEHRLSIDDRLRLFISVCDAVQHAHQKGVIHRDLKPSNILVTIPGGSQPSGPRTVPLQPLPKVIDFGVAKVLRGALAGTALVTQLGQSIGTPAYMAPEQLGGGDGVDTRADVYSLGVVLYELLCGSRPFEADGAGGVRTDGAPRMSREAGAQRPSVRAGTRPEAMRRRGEVSSAPVGVSTDRATDERGLRRRLRGDLDWITMRALEREPARRYASVSDLAADLRRHLGHEPVEAGPPSAWYRTRKFARRHRVPVGAGLALLGMLISGLAVSTRLYLQVQAQRDEIRARAEARAALAADLQRRLNAYSGALARQTAVMSLASNIASVGRIRERLAEEYLENQSVLLYGGSTGSAGERYLARLGYAHEWLGDAKKFVGKTAEALSQYESALAIRHGLRASNPGNADLRKTYAVGLWMVADANRAMGRAAGALAADREAPEEFRSIAASGIASGGRAPSQSVEESWSGYLAMAHRRIGDSLASTGDHEGAVAEFGRAVALAESQLLLPSDALTAQTRNCIRALLGRARAANALGRPTEATDSIARALWMLDRLSHETGPYNVMERTMQAWCLVARAEAHRASGERPAAMADAEAAFGLAAAVAATDPYNFEAHWARARALAEIGMAAGGGNGAPAGTGALREAVLILESLTSGSREAISVRLGPEGQQSSASLGIEGFRTEDFEDCEMIEGLLLEMSFRDGTHHGPSSSVPSVVRIPREWPAAWPGAGTQWDGEHAFLNRVAAVGGGAEAPWGDVALHFPAGARSVGMGVSSLQAKASLYVNGEFHSDLNRHLPPTGGAVRNGYVRIDARAGESIYSIVLVIDSDGLAPQSEGILLDRLAFDPATPVRQRPPATVASPLLPLTDGPGTDAPLCDPDHALARRDLATIRRELAMALVAAAAAPGSKEVERAGALADAARQVALARESLSDMRRGGTWLADDARLLEDVARQLASLGASPEREAER